MNNHSHVLGSAPQAPWYAQRWPWLLMLGPASVVVAGAFTTYLAVTRDDALVVGDYYKQGQAINQDLRRDRMASALQLSARIRFDARNGRLDGTLTSFGRPFTGAFQVMLAHPTQPEKDLALTAHSDGAGRFGVALPALEHTHWQVVIEGEQKDWKLARSWDYPKHAELTITADPP